MSASRAAHREDVRSEILEASIALMNEGGLGALSMREVARRAGVSHQAPYHYFPDRGAILAELAGEGFDKLTEALNQAFSARSDPAGRTRALGEAYVRFALGHPEVFRLMFRCEMVDLASYPAAKEKADRCFEFVAGALGAGGAGDMASGTMGSAELVPVIALWSTAHGLATLILEGKLGEGFGETTLEREEAAGRVLALVAEKMAR